MTDKEQAVYQRRSECLRDDTLALALAYTQQLACKLRAIQEEGIAEADVCEAMELERPIGTLLEAIY